MVVIELKHTQIALVLQARNGSSASILSPLVVKHNNRAFALSTETERARQTRFTLPRLFCLRMKPVMDLKDG